ncbi:Hypothetical protein, putative membrane nuclease [Mycoplasmopsis bovigenitalium 51080]|uniref:Uncharacterized protein n=1 Tax=Mycoplasmopsis bovigenitalium 51080 TaxID=1188235 RepID=N9V3N5_9BACT|nr:hypothetical protein [Mycoplasmopsis bovigenitalium]ENY69977.1 Hypothetical protein, putative membrane nuclease [Mycoplasmopsis bovigenitalium 51080]
MKKPRFIVPIISSIFFPLLAVSCVNFGAQNQTKNPQKNDNQNPNKKTDPSAPKPPAKNPGTQKPPTTTEPGITTPPTQTNPTPQPPTTNNPGNANSPKPIDNQAWEQLKKDIWQPEYVEGKTHFVRVPYYVKLHLNNTGKTIGLWANHLDSPDNKKGSEPYPSQSLKSKYSSINSQGAQEVSEFLALKEVMLTPTNDDFIIYGGDTNIKNKNYFLIKEILNNTNIESILSIKENLANKTKYNETFLTSLGTKGNYSHQYDKMMFINNDKNSFNPTIVENNHKPFKINIFRTFDHIISKQELNFSYNAKSKPDYSMIRSKISDHAPVLTDIENNFNISTSSVGDKLKTNQNLGKNKNTIRIGHWNILNYSGNDDNQDSIAKTKAITETIKKAGFDAIALTEINDGAGESAAKTLKKYLPNHYEIAVQEAKYTKINDYYINSKRFGKLQQEQVIVVYNKNVFSYYGQNLSWNKPIKYWTE